LHDEGRIGVLHADLGHLARGNGSSGRETGVAPRHAVWLMNSRPFDRAPCWCRV